MWAGQLFQSNAFGRSPNRDKRLERSYLLNVGTTMTVHQSLETLLDNIAITVVIVISFHAKQFWNHNFHNQIKFRQSIKKCYEFVLVLIFPLFGQTKYRTALNQCLLSIAQRPMFSVLARVSWYQIIPVGIFFCVFAGKISVEPVHCWLCVVLYFVSSLVNVVWDAAVAVALEIFSNEFCKMLLVGAWNQNEHWVGIPISFHTMKYYVPTAFTYSFDKSTKNKIKSQLEK